MLMFFMICISCLSWIVRRKDRFRNVDMALRGQFAGMEFMTWYGDSQDPR
jgi:hypothetical protein